ncbi:retrotransposon protein, putative, ty1-copia subclass [Tanacetum coccineum]
MTKEEQNLVVVVTPKFDMPHHLFKLTSLKVKSVTKVYGIPLELHPRVPSEGMTMNELSESAIGLYEQFFDFSGVMVPFSTLLLGIIKHFQVHISQLVPLGLNRSTMFELDYRSLGITPTVNLFRVRAIPDSMAWRHHDSDVYDPLPDDDYSIPDVRTLAEKVIDLRPVHLELLFTAGLATVWEFPGVLITMSEYLHFPFTANIMISKVDVIPAMEKIVQNTTHPLLKNQNIPEKTNSQREVEVKDEKVLAAKKKKKVQAARAAAKRKDGKTRTDGGEGSSKPKSKRRKTLANEVVHFSSHESADESVHKYIYVFADESNIVGTSRLVSTPRSSHGYSGGAYLSEPREILRGESSKAIYAPQWVLLSRCRVDSLLGCREMMVHLAQPSAQEYGYVKYHKKSVKKRTRERMSDQEAKEIKAEAREIMPQPSTVITLLDLDGGWCSWGFRAEGGAASIESTLHHDCRYWHKSLGVSNANIGWAGAERSPGSGTQPCLARKTKPVAKVIPIRRSERPHRAPNRLCLNVEVEEHSLGDLNEPTSYKAAMLDSESNKWIDAMNAEIQSMMDNMVWVLVDLPPGCKTVGSRWLFKKKTDMDGIVHVYKARLVAKGYTQLYGVDYEETFSPVADIRAIRILISIAAYYDYEIWQMDVKTAFLNGYLDEDIYMVQPEGFVDPNHPRKVCKLQRSIYGLKQASRSWNKRFDEEIKRFGFTQNLDEPCVYQKASGSNVTFLILDRSKRLIRLVQNAYMDKILKRYRMDNSKRGHIPMQERLDLNKTQGTSTPKEVKRMQNVPYASVVGSIMYAVRCTRPDVAFTQNITNRFQQNPGELHWTAVKNILKYLRNTKDMFLVYGGNPEAELQVDCYCDAGFETDRDDTKSQTGYVFILNGGVVDWKSSKQSTIWIRKFILGLGIQNLKQKLNT